MALTIGRQGSSASSGADSHRSDETVKGIHDDTRFTPVRIRAEDRQRYQNDCEISPGSRPQPSPFTRTFTAPWEDSDTGSLNQHPGHAIGISSNPSYYTSALSMEGTPTGTGQRFWPSGAAGPPSAFGDYLHDLPEERSLSLANKHPGMSRTQSIEGGYTDDRRPSVASAETVSSTGSGRSTSRAIHKKLHDFFQGDVSSVPDSRYSSQTSLPTKQQYSRNSPLHNPINGGLGSRSISPGVSRPRTPHPSSEVTPWLFQDEKDISNFGDAPVHQDPTEQEQRRRQSLTSSKTSSTPHSSRIHLHRHRHDTSTGDPVNSDESHNQLTKIPTFRNDSFVSERRATQGTAPDFSSWTTGPQRQSSLSSSNGSLAHRASTTMSRQSTNDSGGEKKRSLLDRIRHRHKNDNRNDQAASAPLKSLSGSSNSIQPLLTPAKPSEITSSTNNAVLRSANISDQTPLAQATSLHPNLSLTTSRKEHHARLPFKSKRGFTSETPLPKIPNTGIADSNVSESLWNLDTDLSRMEGIVGSNDQPLKTPPPSNATTGRLREETLNDPHDSDAPLGIWDAPDSWAVKRTWTETDERRHEIDDEVQPQKDADSGSAFCLRIFRPDSTFATLSVGLNTTVTEMIQILGKKTFLQDDLNSYQIILRKQHTSRQLEPGERPLVIQKKLLEQAGYNDSDHIDELGREDHSYLCRFNFMPAKMSGFSSLEKDPGFNKMQKFSNLDLSERNLINIPIALYQKSNEIVFLNLSHNLSLDVPKDFIQGCTSLREIKYTGNEARRLPPSFNLANRLTVLDISNNCLEQLETADLDKLESLASLKLANNKLTSLPKYFAAFKGLRSLNVSSNFLPQLPSCVCEIKTLVDLDISFNSISSLPQLGQLENLERLWATNNKLSGSLEDNISNLHNLREIDIRFNAIDSIDILAKLPQLEQLMAGHNSISAFEGSFTKIRTLYLDHNPVTSFSLGDSVPTLSTLSLASAKLAQLPNELFQKMTGLTKLILNKNHFVSLSPQLGRLQKLDHLSIAKNSLSTLPPEIGRLFELRFLDARENNINQLPSELWFCRKLETLNLSSNVLDSFPKPSQHSHLPGFDQVGANGSPVAGLGLVSSSVSTEEMDKLGDFGPRRLSTASGYTSSGSSPGNSQRKGSVASMYGQSSRKPPSLSRTTTEGTISLTARKDSMLMNRASSTFSGSLRHLFLADNRLSDDVFDQLAILQELRTVNLSYNELYDIPPRTIRRWLFLSELYLSGNDLSSLPCEDFEEVSALKVLHVNGNKLQVLPAELGKAQKLAVLDVGSNSLKYNVSNWPYDWNWNYNPKLKFLNLSGNKRLEIKPTGSYQSGRENQSLTDFSALQHLRILGLMDVTLMIPSVPDQTEDRRVRTSGSTVGSMAYGIADCLGRNEHLSTIDIVVPRLEGHDDETLVGMFDGVPLSNGGSKIVKYLQENFELQFKDQLKRKQPQETAMDALRRTYLTLNRELAALATQTYDVKERRGLHLAHRGSIATQTINEDDLHSGCVATVMYLHGVDLYVSNVGDAQAVLIQSEGGHRIITEKHDPAATKERVRIREAGGYVSRQGKLNDVLDISRAFGFTQLAPAVVACPKVSQIQLQESDELILLASRELWEYLSPDFAVDVARSERGDLMRAAQKLRDLAIAFGATGKITVMLVGVSDLRKKERARYRTHSMSMGPSGLPDDYMATRRQKRGRDATLDSKLARLDQEVDAPVGEVSLVFTDIKNSTMLWETHPIAMRSAIKMHNEVMRRQLRLIGGYEVKTEGDAFMVAFPTVTSALLWCFTTQSQLLDVQWPQEILSSVSGQEVIDPDGTVLFRGLSVRMGIHWGQPVCETDPVTRRMDYFGPMVNRAARIAAVADGGQITVSSDFIAEVQRLLETHIEADRSNSTGSEDQLNDDALTNAIRRELRSLSSHGFEVKDLGEKRLKGLENPEYIYLMYPHSLSGRLIILQQRAEAEKAAAEGAGAKSRDSQLTIELDTVWDLWNVSLRLEMLCSTLESRGCAALKPPETALLERTRERGGEVTDLFLINFVEHQVSRIETCITSLAVRDLVRPFKNGMLQQACPMNDILGELKEQLTELQNLKRQDDIDLAPA